LANNTLNLCHGRLQEVWEEEHLETDIIGDEIIFCEQGHVVGEIGPFTSYLSLSTSVQTHL
jgi:hypothetical protein